MVSTDVDQNIFPTQYYITAPCYLKRDGCWTPAIEEAGLFESTELQYRFLDGCTLKQLKPDKQ
jgi:hypothetical protein